MLEKLVLQRISPHLRLLSTQHGFSPGRSTTTALLPLAQQLAPGFDQYIPALKAAAMAADFSKIFRPSWSHYTPSLHTRQHHRIKLCQMTMHLPAWPNGVLQLLQARINENNSTSRSTWRFESLNTVFQSICVHIPRDSRTQHFLCRGFHCYNLKPKGRASCLGHSKSRGRCWCVGGGNKSTDTNSEINVRCLHAADSTSSFPPNSPPKPTSITSWPKP